MALILSLATGNFNAGATWVGGIVPGAADEARASTGHTITITANVTCTELSNAGTGIFTLNDGVTLTANVTNKTTTGSRNCLQFTAASPATASIVGNVTGGITLACGGVVNSSTGTLVITGNCVAGSGAGGSVILGCFGASNSSTGTITVTGNCTGGSGANSHGIQNTSTGSISITGNATGGSSTGVGAYNNSSGTITFTGNCVGGTTVTTSHGLNNASTGVCTIVGTCTGGAAGATGANNAAAGTITATRAKGNGFGIGSVDTAAGVGIASVQSSITKIEQLEFGALGMSPVSGPCYITPLTTNVAIFTKYPGGTGTKTLVDATASAGMPAITDVRFGTSYASGALTGSAYIPSAGSVAFGVPVDATTGTATLTAADVRAAIGMASANLDTQLAAIPTAVTNANAVWDELMSSHTTAGTYGGRIVRATNANNELQLNAQNHAAANVHQFQAAVIESVAFATSAVTLFTGAMRTELTPELTEITEVHAIHGLDIANALTVTPTSRTSGAITQAITGDGTTSTIVTRV